VVEQEYSLNPFALLLLEDIEQILIEYPKSIEPENNLKQKINLFRVINRPALLFQNMRKSVKEHGYVLTFRLLLEQIERFIGYFELSLRRKRK
jgi:hypothetical protein